MLKLQCLIIAKGQGGTWGRGGVGTAMCTGMGRDRGKAISRGSDRSRGKRETSNLKIKITLKMDPTCILR